MQNYKVNILGLENINFVSKFLDQSGQDYASIRHNLTSCTFIMTDRVLYKTLTNSASGAKMVRHGVPSMRSIGRFL